VVVVDGNLERKRALTELLVKYTDIISSGSHDLGRTKLVKHTIDTGDAAPLRSGLRRVSFNERDQVRIDVDKMLSNGIIERSNSPWASPVVLLRKKDEAIRFCIDYRRLNNVTKKDAYPLPRIDDTLESLSGATCFSTIDLAAGYWQVEMTEEDKAKTAFVSHVGLFQFTKMPFGLCNAPSTFQRLMESVLAGLTWEECLVYLDDIIIYARNFNEHLERLKHVFERLRDGGLKIKLDKYKFLVEEVKYLGHTVTKYGVKPDNKKIECIEAWPT
jgi:hypothetical protein